MLGGRASSATNGRSRYDTYDLRRREEGAKAERGRKLVLPEPILVAAQHVSLSCLSVPLGASRCICSPTGNRRHQLSAIPGAGRADKNHVRPHGPADLHPILSHDGRGGFRGQSQPQFPRGRRRSIRRRLVHRNAECEHARSRSRAALSRRPGGSVRRPPPDGSHEASAG